MTSVMQASALGLGIALLVASLTPTLLGAWWVANLMASLRLHLALLGGLITMAGLMVRSPPLTALGVGAVALNATAIAASLWLTAPAAGDGASGGARLRVMSLNLLYTNRNLAALKRCVADVRPDLLLVQEASPFWVGALDGLKDHLPYRVGLHASGAGEGEHGVMLLSRYPPVDAEQRSLGGLPNRLAAARLVVAGREMWAASVHLIKPTTPANLGRQRQQFEELGAWIEERNAPLVLGGDLNSTLYSSHMRRFISATGVDVDHPTRSWLRLISSTFPAALPVLGLKIDYVMVRGPSFERSWTVPCAGSDHRAVVAEIHITAAGPATRGTRRDARLTGERHAPRWARPAAAVSAAAQSVSYRIAATARWWR